MATQQEVFNSLTTEILRIGAKLDGIRGPGVTNKPDSITINSPPASQSTPAPFPTSNIRPIVISGNETGGGFYKGFFLTGSASQSNAASTLSLPLSGMSTGTNSILIFNPAENGSTTHLISASDTTMAYGAGLIIGVTTEATPRPIAMLLEGPKSGLFPVLTTQTSGSAGNTTTACTFMYTVTDYFTSATLGTGIGLETPRYLKVAMNAATNGTAFWGMSGTTRVVKLWQAFETATQTSCT